MKNLFKICAIIVVLVGFSSSTFAQTSTGTAPHIGATHSYTVDSHGTNTFAWSVTTDYAGATPIDYSTVATLSATTGNSINITWIAPVVGTTYFVHVVETDAATCSNHKVMAVIPVNGFDLVIASVDNTGANLTDYEECAPNVAVTAYDSGTGSFTYDYGVNTFYFKITASGIGTNAWSPQFTIAGTDTNASYSAEWSTTVGGTYNVGLLVDGTANDIDVTTGTVAFIKVIVDNAEGLAANPITVTVLDDADTSEDVNGNDVRPITSPDDVRIQTVKARPSTSGIVTN